MGAFKNRTNLKGKVLLNRLRTAKRCCEASGQAWGTMERRNFKLCGYRRINEQQLKDKGVEPQELQDMEGENWSIYAYSRIAGFFGPLPVFPKYLFAYNRNKQASYTLTKTTH